MTKVIFVAFHSSLEEMATSTNERKERGKNYFQKDWLVKYQWVKKKSEIHALFTLCNSAIAYANMGEAALKRHEMPSKTDKPTKHQKRAAEKDQATKALSYIHFTKATPNQAIDFTSKQSPAQEEEKVNVNNDSVQPSASANKSPQANQQSSTSESTQVSGQSSTSESSQANQQSSTSESPQVSEQSSTSESSQASEQSSSTSKYLQASEPSSSVSKPSPKFILPAVSSSSSQSTLTNYVLPMGVVTAEIRCA